MVRDEQNKDETWKHLIAHLKDPTQSQQPKLPGKYNVMEFCLCNGLLYRSTVITSKGMSRGKIKQLVIPSTFVSEILKLIHDSAHSSHPGKEKTYKQAQLKYFWLNMR